jgi:DNA-binding transcriptional MerR regulator
MDGSWTIAELAELAAGALAAADHPQHGVTRANGRVRDVPNERLIRWYVTVGLLDPPLSRRGRTARYGPRHLLQLVAIKRRQAEGRSLAEIQAELAGSTNASLAAVARVPDAVLAAAAGSVSGPARATGAATVAGPARAAMSAAVPDAAPALAAGASPAPARFWAQRPEPDTASAQARPRDSGAPQASGPDTGRGAVSGRPQRPRLVPGVWLAPGVTMLLDCAEREPSPQDLAEIATAAGPLLQVLASAGLCPKDQSASPTTAPPGTPPGDPEDQERSRT